MPPPTRDDIPDVIHRARAAVRSGSVRPSYPGLGLKGANMSNIRIYNLGLPGADLEGADLRNGDYWYIDLTNANLTGAHLQCCELVDGNLTNANFTDANLQGADLRGTNLDGAVLTRANLRGTWLRHSNLAPEQMLASRGLQFSLVASGIPLDHWNAVLPDEPSARKLTITLLDDWAWDGTLQELLERVQQLDSDGQKLLAALLQDWEGTLGEAITAAEELRRARPRAARPCPCWTVQHPRTGSSPAGTLGAPTEKEDPDAP